MARRYGSFTAKRKAALRKAQLSSAAKRRGRGRKIALGTAAVGITGVGVVFGSKILGHPKYSPGPPKYSPGPPKMLPRAHLAISSAHPNRAVLDASNYAHTPEARRIRKRKYLHSNQGYTKRSISEAEAHRRTTTYIKNRALAGHKVGSLERSRVKNYYRGRTV